MDSPIYKLITIKTCLSGATCAGSANERISTIGYQAGSSTVPGNALPVTINLKDGVSGTTLSATTTTAYDSFGNVTSVDGPLSGSADTTAFKYDAQRRPIGMIGPDPDGAGSGNPNLATRTTFDVKGRAWKTEQGTTNGQSDTSFASFAPASRTESTFDDADRLVDTRTISGTTTYGLAQYSYDARGRLDCAAVRMNPANFASPPASACTLDTPGSDGNDRIAKYTYNLADEVLQVETAYGTTTSITEAKTYTLNGKLATVRDGELNLTTYEYDGHDRLSKTRYPVGTAGANVSSTTDYEQMTYDAASNVTNLRLRSGDNIVMTYDGLNRIRSRTPTSETPVVFTYNLLGQQILLDKGSTDVAMTWDALGRMTSQTQPYGSVSYQYDLSGNMTRMTWSDGFYAVYDYDSAGRVTKVRQNGATSGIGVLATYAYDSLGRRSTVTFGNGTSRAYQWDPISRLEGLGINLAGTANDLTIGQASGMGVPITYNSASQIRTIARSNDAYAYTLRANVSRTYVTNGLNQYTQSGPVSLGYDARGNLTASGANTYSYSRLNEMIAGPGVSAMGYDALGRMISYTSASTTRFNYSGGSIIDERNTFGTILRRFVHGPGVDEPIVWYEGSGTTQRRWMQADERGSVVTVSDDAGAIIGINKYDEFGIPASSNIGRFQYTGQTWYPELGLYNFKARFYSATLGRFMGTDPIGYVDGMNLYNYVGADPINGTDPSGLSRIPTMVRQDGRWVIAKTNGTYYGTSNSGRLIRDFDGKETIVNDGWNYQESVATGVIRRNEPQIGSVGVGRRETAERPEESTGCSPYESAAYVLDAVALAADTASLAAAGAAAVTGATGVGAPVAVGAGGAAVALKITGIGAGFGSALAKGLNGDFTGAGETLMATALGSNTKHIARLTVKVANAAVSAKKVELGLDTALLTTGLKFSHSCNDR